MLSVVDKAIVPVGEPGNPISTGIRGHHRTLVTVGGQPLLHWTMTFIYLGWYPSVALLNPPCSDSFFLHAWSTFCVH